MIVRYVYSEIDSVDDQSATARDLHRSMGVHGSAPDLTIGTLYTVYAIIIKDHDSWYFVADDLYKILSCPIAYSSQFFDVVDVRVSSCWTVGFRNVGSTGKGMRDMIFAFLEWVEDIMFYERLLDGDSADVELFRKYKDFMDMEYPQAFVRDTAELIEDNWLMCSICIDCWQSDSVLGMVRCPKCSAMLLNPRYSSSDLGAV